MSTCPPVETNKLNAHSTSTSFVPSTRDVPLSPLRADVYEERFSHRTGFMRRRLVCRIADDRCDDTVRWFSGRASRRTNRQGSKSWKGLPSRALCVVLNEKPEPHYRYCSDRDVGSCASRRVTSDPGLEAPLLPAVVPLVPCCRNRTKDSCPTLPPPIPAHRYGSVKRHGDCGFLALDL